MKLRQSLAAGFCTLAMGILSAPAMAAPVLSDFVLYGTGSVTVGSNVIANSPAMIGSGGNVSLGSGNYFNGQILSEGSVSVGSNSSITGGVLAGNNISVGSGAAMGGAVHAGNNVNSGNNAVYTGTASAGGTVTLGNNTWINPGSTHNGVALPLVPLPSSLPGANSFAPGSVNKSVTSASPQSLAAGSYGNLNTGSGSILTLTAGTYYFNQVNFGSGTLVNLDLGMGAIIINIAGDLSGASNLSFVLNNGGSAADVLFEVHGAASIGSGSLWNGTLFALGQDITFGNNSTINGALYGDDVKIGAGSALAYIGSNVMAGWDAPVGPNPQDDVSEPAALGILGLGLAGLAWRRRRAA